MELIFGGIIIAIIAVVYQRSQSKKQYDENSRRITNGLTYDDVVSLMGAPAYENQYTDGAYGLVYTRTEWDFVFGGKKTRRIEVIFSAENIVISVQRTEN